jgi:hypothetical protein
MLEYLQVRNHSYGGLKVEIIVDKGSTESRTLCPETPTLCMVQSNTFQTDCEMTQLQG